jgi:hypothetical protein
MSSRSALLLGALALVLLSAGCGAGHGVDTSTSTATGNSATGHTSSPTRTATSITSSNGAATAVLPAHFIVGADDSVTPPTISGPAGTQILLTVTSKASHPIRLAVASHTLSVATGGRASARIPPLKAGDYPITVNGAKHASLAIGVQPGP